MSEAWVSIGGVRLRLEGEQSVQLAMSLPGMKVFETTPAIEDAKVCFLEEVGTGQRVQELHRFPVADGNVVVRFGEDERGRYIYDFEGQGRVCVDEARPEVVLCSPMTNMFVLRFVLWVVWSMVGLRKRVLPVHASTVVYEPQTEGADKSWALLCLGESGTGKSTHTRLWIEHIAHTYLLNDDSPLVAVEDDGVWVYGSPWSGKTPCYRNERHRVAAMLRIQQRPENSIRQLGMVEAFAAVQPSCPPCLMKAERLQDGLVEYVGSVIERVPTWLMGCLPDKEAAMMSCGAIFGR